MLSIRNKKEDEMPGKNYSHHIQDEIFKRYEQRLTETRKTVVDMPNGKYQKLAEKKKALKLEKTRHTTKRLLKNTKSA